MPVIQPSPIYQCDLCGNAFDYSEMQCVETNAEVITGIRCEIWYGGTYTAKYICKSCQGHIMRAITELNPAKAKFIVDGWEKRK